MAGKKVGVVFGKAAFDDLIQATDHYRALRKDLDIEFMKDLNSDVEHLSEFPASAALRYKDVRVSFMKRFPFGLHYRIKKDHVRIIAVFHTSLSPKKWRFR